MKIITDHIETLMTGLTLATILGFGMICFNLGKLDA